MRSPGDDYYSDKDNNPETFRVYAISYNGNPGSVGGFAGVGSIGFTYVGPHTGLGGGDLYVSNAELNERDRQTLLKRLQ